MIDPHTLAKIGTGTTTASVVTTFLATAMPVVQFLAACVGLAVGVVTFIYWVKQLRKK